MQKYKYVLFAHQTYKSDCDGTSAETIKTLDESLNVYITLLKSNCKQKLPPSAIQNDMDMFSTIDENKSANIVTVLNDIKNDGKEKI